MEGCFSFLMRARSKKVESSTTPLVAQGVPAVFAKPCANVQYLPLPEDPSGDAEFVSKQFRLQREGWETSGALLKVGSRAFVPFARQSVEPVVGHRYRTERYGDTLVKLQEARKDGSCVVLLEPDGGRCREAQLALSDLRPLQRM